MAIGGKTRGASEASSAASKAPAKRRNIFAEAVATAKDSAIYEDLFPEGTWRVKLLRIEDLESSTKPVFEMMSEGETQGQIFAALLNKGANAKSKAVYASNMVSMVRCFAGMTADEFREYDPEGEFVNAMIEGVEAPDDKAGDTIIGEEAEVQVRRGPDREGHPGDWFRNHYWAVAE